MADFIWTNWPPAPGPITGRFAEPGGAYPEGGHRGLDIGCPVGTPVIAPVGGKVVEFTNDGSFGNGVCIDVPGTPWYVLLAHLGRADVHPGEMVRGGQQIGLSGATGRVTGPHLHVQVCRVSSFPVDITRSADPLAFVPAVAPAAGGGEGLDVRVAAIEARVAELNAALVAERFELGRLALNPDITLVRRAVATLRTAGIIGGGS